jgi:hypothetical protein
MTLIRVPKTQNVIISTEEHLLEQQHNFHFEVDNILGVNLFELCILADPLVIGVCLAYC